MIIQTRTTVNFEYFVNEIIFIIDVLVQKRWQNTGSIEYIDASNRKEWTKFNADVISK